MNDPGSLPLRQLGRYAITRELRREKSSVSYLGLDPVMHREVVLKAVQLPPPTDATAHSDAQIDPLEQAFVRQAQAAGRLSHPHIVTVFEAGRVRDIGYLAIERVNGRALHDLLASGWRPQFVHCASIAARIADAIEYAHQQGVAHGQLGPQHVMLQIDGAPKIEGFGGWIDGGSSGEEALKRTESVLPYFHSELSEEARRRDVRAVAALAFMMLTGKAPGDKPAPVASLRPDVPATLARLIDEVLAANGGLRRTAADLRDALTAFIWNERRENIAPATIGIPLAAPPPRPPAAPTGNGPHAAPPDDAPTVAMTLTGQPGAPAAPRPHTLTLRIGTQPNPTQAASAPQPPPAPSTPWTERLAAAWSELLAWLRANRLLAGGIAGLAVVALGIAAILASTAGPTHPRTTTRADPTAAVQPTDGVLRLDIAPWGEVFVNGKPIGVSPPLQELKLPAGPHAVEIRYGDKAAVSARVEVDPAKPLQIRHRFE